MMNLDDGSLRQNDDQNTKSLITVHNNFRGVQEGVLEETSSFGGCIKDFFVGYAEDSPPENPIQPKINIASVTKSVFGKVSLSTCYTD